MSLIKISFKQDALKKAGTDFKTEVIAGFTTFLAMAYILAVNPSILSGEAANIPGFALMDKGAVFTATALSAAIATLVMGIFANLPFALAPGMGLNAFLTYTVCLTMENDCTNPNRIRKSAASVAALPNTLILIPHWCVLPGLFSAWRAAAACWSISLRHL